MALNLPPDPYKVLGVSKDAKLAEIRSSHRKLVLKCHPDKVQDAALKAVKQDEFQKVQQAYELLSDDNKRIQYDEQMKVFKLRAELGRGSAGGPSIRTGASPFDYEIKIAEPGPTTYSRTTSTSAHAPYSSYPPSKSYEEVYDVKYRTAKKSASYESTEKRRLSTRDGDRERIYRSDERERERDREKYEKESSKAAHADKKKTKDREKRRGTEEKTRSRTAYVEDESDNYRQQPPKKEKSERRRVEEELPIQYKREREEKPKDSSHAKMENRKEFAFQYMQAARQKLK
ncbi:putative DnaJ like protein subfamily C member 21, partial [Calycina marina]